MNTTAWTSYRDGRTVMHTLNLDAGVRYFIQKARGLYMIDRAVGNGIALRLAEAVTLKAAKEWVALELAKAAEPAPVAPTPTDSARHLGLTQDQMRAKTGSTGDFEGPNPLCGNGNYHALVTQDRAKVSCAACLLKMHPQQRGPLNSYKVEAIAELAAQIRSYGHRVFLAESGTYGFYTDTEGRTVVSFQFDLGGFKFSGNYKPRSHMAGRTTGTGWIFGNTYEISREGLQSMLDSHAPHWATNGLPVDRSSLVMQLRDYQSSSRFAEVTK